MLVALHCHVFVGHWNLCRRWKAVLGAWVWLPEVHTQPFPWEFSTSLGCQRQAVWVSITIPATYGPLPSSHPGGNLFSPSLLLQLKGHLLLSSCPPRHLVLSAISLGLYRTEVLFPRAVCSFLLAQPSPLPQNRSFVHPPGKRVQNLLEKGGG